MISREKRKYPRFFLLIGYVVLVLVAYIIMFTVGRYKATHFGGGTAATNTATATSSFTKRKKKVSCKTFDDGLVRKGPPSSTVESIFNCDLASSPCRYYYPARFLDPTCGEGRTYNKFVTECMDFKNNGTLWLNMPSIGFPTFKFESTLKTPDSMNGTSFLDETISFVHVHKAGGTTLHNAYTLLSKLTKRPVIRHRWFMPGRRVRRIRKSNSSKSEEELMWGVEKTVTKIDTHESSMFLSNATVYPEDGLFEGDQHVLFAVVRDPVERFISSIGQAMGGSGSQTNQVSQWFQRRCIKESSQETLRCCIDYVKEHGWWFELHFTPQVLDISFSTMWMDIPVALFPFRHLPDILQHFGTPQTHSRDGSAKSYRPHPVLTNMTMTDYDDAMLRDVCTIYEMDVVMQRSLGMEVPK
eukprot:CAMPEP_0198297392 /NCGR_PEP_ID=MMETSP1449-20131203/36789_1 /TAXON_ID=420275 /ORGANISM="Attheya septentrionalis, Strain CCMP2084" /LENGTH=412 /DNA_ID=CAMNT_0043998311 /DNA_START=210 /DNA_END=1445 /DNA_ORIENTATION=-